MCNYFVDASRGTRDSGEIDAMGRWELAADWLTNTLSYKTNRRHQGCCGSNDDF